MPIFISSNVFFPNSSQGQPARIKVSSTTGKIESIELGTTRTTLDPAAQRVTEEVIDLGDKWLLPGLVDAHVHLNEPGRTEWEGFATGTAAAASGGVTTVIDMPLNAIPPTTTVDHFKLKQEAAKGQCKVDVGFYGGVIPGNQDDLIPLAKEGVKGFKCFLIESGVDEFPCVNEEQVLIAMPKLVEANSLFLFHAELESPTPSLVSSSSSSSNEQDPTSYSTFLSSRPSSLEESAISLILRTASQHPTLRTHIVHLSASSALPILSTARQKGMRISIETCFHYLCLTSEKIEKGETLFKCCPPIREASNREALWQGLIQNQVDFVVSDHSPCVTELKRLEEGDFMKAWGGIGGLGLGLSLLWTEAKRRGVGMDRVLQWVCSRPAVHVGLGKSKGSIEVGKDADFVVFDPELHFKVDKSELHFKNRSSPYEGLELEGAVLKTYLRGELAYDRETGFKGIEPRGQLLL